MIYNLVQYLRTKFPAEVFYINDRYKTSTQESIPDRNVVVKDTGGTEKPWTRYREQTVQILTRDKSDPLAETLINNIFEELTSRFGEILPAKIVSGVSYPAVQIAQISAIQVPYSLGADEEGRMEWTVNFKFIYVKE